MKKEDKTEAVGVKSSSDTMRNCKLADKKSR